MSAPKSAARIALQGMLCLILAMGIGRFAFTPLFPMMQHDGLIDLHGGSLLAAVNFLGYWMGALTAAFLRFPPRAMLRFTLIGTAAVTAAMGLTEHFLLWLLLRWLAGLFSAWTLILVSTHLLRALAEAGHAGRQGWVFTGVGTGIALAGLVCIGLMVANVSSDGSWLLIGAGALLLSLFLSFDIGVEVPHRHFTSSHGGNGKSPMLWSLVFAYGAMGFGYIIPATYLPIMAKAIMPDPMVFGWSWPIFGLAAAFSTLVARPLFARIGNRTLWATAQFIMATGLLLPALFPGMVSTVLSGLMVGGTFVFITLSGMKEVHLVVPPSDANRHIAVLTAAFATGQIVGPPAASYLHDLTGDFTAGLLLAAGLLAVTALPLVATQLQASRRGTAPTA